MSSDQPPLAPARQIRPTIAWIDLDAAAANVAALARLAAPAELMTIVKADGYGHGAIDIARVARQAGATRFGVALVEEAEALRAAGIAEPILVLSQPMPATIAEAASGGIEVTVADRLGVEAAIVAAGTSDPRFGVHLKIDTGMSRMGCTLAEAVELAGTLDQHSPTLRRGTFTHLACADASDPATTNDQLDRFDAVLAALTDAGIDPRLRHASNSAGTLYHPRARYDLVRCGIATYGLSPNPDNGLEPHGDIVLQPVMSIETQVAAVRTVEADRGVSYGHWFHTQRPTVIATLPIGYADGLPRGIGRTDSDTGPDTGAGTAPEPPADTLRRQPPAWVVVRGHRAPIIGVVTMDQAMIDVTDIDGVTVGDRVVVLGDGAATVDDWARRQATINYEMVCGVSRRVPRAIRGGHA